MTRESRVDTIISGNKVLLSDGTVAHGHAAPGSRVVLDDNRHIQASARAEIIGGGQHRKQTFVEELPVEVQRRIFRLVLDSDDHQRPYGALGRLLVFENGGSPKLYGIPHNKMFSDRAQFGCYLTFGEGECKAVATCRNTFGEAPCEAPQYQYDESGSDGSGVPVIGRCKNTYATCRDRSHFAGCPLTFGQAPCYADPEGTPCENTAATCRAVGITRDDFGDCLYANYGGCKNSLADCKHTASFMPFSPELHVYSQQRDEQPWEASLHGYAGGLFVWLGEKETELVLEDNSYTLRTVWLVRTDSPRLPRTTPMGWVLHIPSETIVAWMLADPDATGIGVTDLHYSKGLTAHYICTVQWITSSDPDAIYHGHLVLNTSADGDTWTGQGQILRSDDIQYTENPEAPTWPPTFSRIEYREGRMLEAQFSVVEDGKVRQKQRKVLYCLRGYIRGRCSVTDEGGNRRDYDEMRIDLMAGTTPCTFDPPIVRDAYITEWPASPTGLLIDPGSWPEGTLLATWHFDYAGAGWPDGVYEVVAEGGCIQLFVPVNKVLGYRDMASGSELLTVPVLMRYVSANGIHFTDGAPVTDAQGHYMTCTNSVPVCKWWDGAKCVVPGAFCGVEVNGRYHAYYPACNGHGTAAYDGDEKYSRYEPGTKWGGPTKYFRQHIKGLPPAFALAGCETEGEFVCRGQCTPYEGQFCALTDCEGFTPRGHWGSAGVNILDTLKSNRI